MPSAFRSFSTGGYASGAGPNATIAKPAGTVDGDVLIATFIANNTGVMSLVPGWTKLFSNATSWGKTRTQFFRVAAGEPASYAWASSSDALAGVIVAVSGTTGVKDASATQINGASSIVTGPAFTTAQADETIVWAGFRNDLAGSGFVTVTKPTNLTLRATVYAGANTSNPALWVATGQFASAGALTAAEKDGSLQTAAANMAAIIAFLPGAAPLITAPPGSMFLGSL